MEIYHSAFVFSAFFWHALFVWVPYLNSASTFCFSEQEAGLKLDTKTLHEGLIRLLQTLPHLPILEKNCINLLSSKPNGGLNHMLLRSFTKLLKVTRYTVVLYIFVCSSLWFWILMGWSSCKKNYFYFFYIGVILLLLPFYKRNKPLQSVCYCDFLSLLITF